MVKVMNTSLIVECTVEKTEKDGVHAVSLMSDSGVGFEINDIRDSPGDYDTDKIGWFHEVESGDRVRVRHYLDQNTRLKVEPISS